jgi:hypothetical protein
MLHLVRMAERDLPNLADSQVSVEHQAAKGSRRKNSKSLCHEQKMWLSGCL